jgi:hypothetical protein
MNIVEAFNKLKENPKLKIQFEDRKFIEIEGKLYCSFNNKAYIHVGFVDEYCFSYIEIMSTDWEVVE